MSELVSLIKKLSKSSPQAVFTQKSNINSEAQDISDYLYIETEIENYYKDLLEKNISQRVVIFLCGSSGDGKVAIIGKIICVLRNITILTLMRHIVSNQTKQLLMHSLVF